MGSLSKKELGKPLSLRIEHYAMPEWGDDAYIRVRELSAAQQLELKQFAQGKKVTEIGLEFGYRQLAFSIVDDDGKELFTDAEDVKQCLNISTAKLIELIEFITEISTPKKKNGTAKKS